MSEHHRLRHLATLTSLREREVDKRNADMVERGAVRRRYVGNIERLEKLCQSTGATSLGAAKTIPALSLNGAAYKQDVMKMTDAHRLDLSLHDAGMEVARRMLVSAVRSHEALDHELGRVHATLRHHRSKRDQKLQDETALQMWARRRK